MDSSEVILNKVLQANEKHRFAPPSFLEFRKKEIDIVTSLYKLKKVPLILEIGGGLPIQAAMLSRFSERFLCLDLLQSTGIWNTDVEKRVKLIEAACAREVILVYGDAQYIPLLNDSVDVIYSSNVLEHIKDVHSCLSENYRVLKKGGLAIHVVPAPIGVFGMFYKHYTCLLFRILLRAVRFLKQRLGLRDKTATRVNDAEFILTKEGGNRGLLKKIKANLFPPVHGEYYKSHLDEFLSSFPGRWVNLFLKHNFSLKSLFSTRFAIFECTPNPKINLWLYKRGERLLKFLGNKTPFKYLGTYICLIFEK